MIDLFDLKMVIYFLDTSLLTLKNLKKSKSSIRIIQLLYS